MVIILLMFIIAIIGYFGTLKFLIDAGKSDYQLVLEFLNLVGIAVPYYMPVILSVCTIFSQARLLSHKIFCINN